MNTSSGVVLKFGSSLKCVDDVEMATSERNGRTCKLSEGTFP
jgi:hypothetical protein